MSVPVRITVAVAVGVLTLSGCGPDLQSGANSPFGSGGTGRSISALTTPDDRTTGPVRFDSNCLPVGGSYASIAMAMLPALGGSGTYDAGSVTKAIGGLGGDIPLELKVDFEALRQAAQSAQGKSFRDAIEILDAPGPAAATDHISAWLDKNCGGY